MNVIVASSMRPVRRFRRLGVLALVLALAVGLAGGLVVARATQLRDAVLPGVSVAGVDVGGLERSRAESRVLALVGSRLERPVAVVIGARELRLRPSVVLELDARATADRAFAAGRNSFWTSLGSLVAPFAFTHDVEPVIRVRADGPGALAVELERVIRRPVSARVAMVGLEPVVSSGRPGVDVDQKALVLSLLDAALAGEGRVEARARRVLPTIRTTAANAAAARAVRAVAAPVALTLDGEALGELTSRQLARLVHFQPGERAYEVVLERDRVTRLLEPLVAPKTRAPVDATFEVTGGRITVVPSEGGTQLAASKAASAVRAAALGGGDRVAALDLAKREAELTTRDAKALGVREEISTFTTDMGASSSNRISNVHLLGDLLDGTVLRPGETFSFNRVLGPRTPERGFLEGQMIFAGVLIPSIGGGVCQTATTIFNAAFEAGLPIEQRLNHSFYISHYPVGRDATVSWGGPDLVFKNDLENAILIEAQYTDETFTVMFYGTDQRRTVEATTSEPTNYTAPELQYAIDPTAAPGSVRTTAAGASGFDVNVHRRVYEDSRLVREDDFYTRYTPENPTQVYGPGGDPPGPYFVLPTS